MAKHLITNKVCELLAQQLSTEQAEVVKHQAVVDGIMNRIFEAKKSLIMDKIQNDFFRIDGKKVYAIDVQVDQLENKISVCVNFAVSPDYAIQEGIILTKREAELFADYRKAFKQCFRYSSDGATVDQLKHLAISLKRLKNQVCLTFCHFWDISYDDATDPDFLKRTGLTTGEFDGYTTRKRMLEDKYFWKH